MEGHRLVGVVKWFSDTKGYGYVTAVTPDEQKVDYFVHWKNIISNHKFKKLKEGWTVSFRPDHNEKGDMAMDVRLISINDDYQVTVMKKFFSETKED